MHHKLKFMSGNSVEFAKEYIIPKLHLRIDSLNGLIGARAIEANRIKITPLLQRAFVSSSGNALPLADFIGKFKLTSSGFKDWRRQTILDKLLLIEKSDEKKPAVVKEWKMRHRGDKA